MHKHYRLCADTLRIRRVASVVATSAAAGSAAGSAAAAYQKTKSAGTF